MLLKWLSFFGLGYLAARQTYRYFWRPLNIIRLLQKRSQSISKLQPLEIRVAKNEIQKEYSLDTHRATQDPFFERTAVFKYTKSQELVTVFAPQNRPAALLGQYKQLVESALSNPFEDELKKFMILNKHVLVSDTPYLLRYRMTDLEDKWQLTIDCATVEKQINQKSSIQFEELLNPKRHFVLIRKGEEPALLVVSQDQPNFDQTFLQQSVQLLFIERDALLDLFASRQVFGLYEVYPNSPFTTHYKSITMKQQDKEVPLHANNQIIRTKQILKHGHAYYNLMLLHL